MSGCTLPHDSGSMAVSMMSAPLLILDDHLGVLVLDGLGQLAEHGGLSDSCHVLEADFGCAGLYQLIGYLAIVFHGMHGRGGDTQGGLWCHAGLESPFDTGYDVTGVVQSAEDTGDVDALCVLHLVLQSAHVVGHGIHAEGVEATVEHVGLDAHLVERLTEGSHSEIGVLARHQIHLLKGTTIGFHSGETAHVDDNGGNTLQLVLTGLELARTLPHVPVDETKLDFFLHKCFSCHVPVDETELDFLFHCYQFKIVID